MPIYEYVCSNCGHRMEVVHSIHGHGPGECPECGGPVKKAFSPPAVHFKGTGWARKESASHVRPSKSKDSDSGTVPAPATADSSASKPETPA